MRFENNLFNYNVSLQFADALLALMSAPKANEARAEWISMYSFAFPATHRNYKHLLYGDMNVLDWTGEDKPLWNRGEEWIPTKDELQYRHPTPAYHFFRMIARISGQGSDYGRIFDSVVTTWDSARTPRLYDRIRAVTTEVGGQVFITILNLSDELISNFRVHLRSLSSYKWAVVRETGRTMFDHVKDQFRLLNDTFSIELSASSLTQIILTSIPLDQIRTIQIHEDTFTPGNVNNLSYLQTTRLRATTLIDGYKHDITNLNIVWSSTLPHAVKVYQSGLVQRVRNGKRNAVISAKTFDHSCEAAIEIL